MEGRKNDAANRSSSGLVERPAAVACLLAPMPRYEVRTERSPSYDLPESGQAVLCVNGRNGSEGTRRAMHAVVPHKCERTAAAPGTHAQRPAQ